MLEDLDNMIEILNIWIKINHKYHLGDGNTKHIKKNLLSERRMGSLKVWFCDGNSVISLFYIV